MTYYLFRTNPVTEIELKTVSNLINTLEGFTEVDKIDWNFDVTKISIETEGKLDLKGIFDELGFKIPLEYFIEEGSDYRIHGTFDGKTFVEETYLALFPAGLNF